jgi:hypothetical protein
MLDRDRDSRVVLQYYSSSGDEENPYIYIFSFRLIIIVIDYIGF